MTLACKRYFKSPKVMAAQMWYWSHMIINKHKEHKGFPNFNTTMDK